MLASIRTDLQFLEEEVNSASIEEVLANKNVNKNSTILSSELPEVEEVKQVLEEKVKSASIEQVLAKKNLSKKSTILSSEIQVNKEEANTSKTTLNIPLKYRNLIFQEELPNEIKVQQLAKIKTGVEYLVNVLEKPSDEFLEKKCIILPEFDNNKKKTLFLDLDETLIHYDSEGSEEIEIDEENTIYINVRPYCLEFLKNISEVYEVFIFTAAELKYAESIINFLDKKNNLIDGIISRSHCLRTNTGIYVKDLRLVSNRKLNDCVLVDNSPIAFGKTIANGIPVLDFINDENDNELIYLEKYLLDIVDCNDLREVNQKHFQLEKLAQE